MERNLSQNYSHKYICDLHTLFDMEFAFNTSNNNNNDLSFINISFWFSIVEEAFVVTWKARLILRHSVFKIFTHTS